MAPRSNWARLYWPRINTGLWHCIGLPPCTILSSVSSGFKLYFSAGPAVFSRSARYQMGGDMKAGMDMGVAGWGELKEL